MDALILSPTDKILADIRSLPSIPGIAGNILTMLNDPDTTAKDIEKKLRMDPGLTANILKIANSSYFGFTARIGSIKQAVVLLGSKRLVQIVMASCVNAILDKPVPGYGLSPGELWRHSIAVSVTSEGLMKLLGLPDSDRVFTAALLHDIGKLVLGSYVNESIEEIEKIIADGDSFESAVRKAVGTDHAEIGAKILSRWFFPDYLVEAVRWHHEPDIHTLNPVLDVVHVANIICMMLGIGTGREELQFEPSDMVVKRLGITSRHTERVASQTLQWLPELEDIFQQNQ